MSIKCSHFFDFSLTCEVIIINQVFINISYCSLKIRPRLHVFNLCFRHYNNCNVWKGTITDTCIIYTNIYGYYKVEEVKSEKKVSHIVSNRFSLLAILFDIIIEFHNICNTQFRIFKKTFWCQLIQFVNFFRWFKIQLDPVAECQFQSCQDFRGNCGWSSKIAIFRNFVSHFHNISEMFLC